jgi:sRNA-binding carbon storage regulator CsrA
LAKRIEENERGLAMAKKMTEILKENGVEVKETSVVQDTIKIEIVQIGGGEIIEAPAGISVKELKQIMNATNVTLAEKSTGKSLKDEDVLTKDCELFKIVIKSNA